MSFVKQFKIDLEVGTRVPLKCFSAILSNFEFLSFKNINSFGPMTFEKVAILEVVMSRAIIWLYDQMLNPSIFEY